MPVERVTHRVSIKTNKSSYNTSTHYPVADARGAEVGASCKFQKLLQNQPNNLLIWALNSLSREALKPNCSNPASSNIHVPWVLPYQKCLSQNDFLQLVSEVQCQEESLFVGFLEEFSSKSSRSPHKCWMQRVCQRISLSKSFEIQIFITLIFLWSQHKNKFKWDQTSLLLLVQPAETAQV